MLCVRGARGGHRVVDGRNGVRGDQGESQTMGWLSRWQVRVGGRRADGADANLSCGTGSAIFEMNFEE